MHRRAWMLGVGSVLLAGLGARAQTVDRLAGSEWGLLELGGAPVTADLEQYVRFAADGEVLGSGGCNRFTGVYSIDGDALGFGPLATTRRACPRSVMEREQALFRVLAATRTFRRGRKDLTLFDAAGAELARFAWRDWD